MSFTQHFRRLIAVTAIVLAWVVSAIARIPSP